MNENEQTPATVDAPAKSTGAASAKAGATPKLTAAARAYRDFKAMVINNELPPGSTYFEPELADLLGVNRAVAHEAAALLEREGLVEVRPRRGVRVLPISADDMREIYDIITELEALAAELAATRGLDPAQAAALEAAHADMERALASDDLAGWAAADTRFHLLLARASGSRRLESAIDIHVAQAHRARMVTLFLRPKPTASNQDHLALLEALKAQDPARARDVHWRHRRNARDLLVDILCRNSLNHV